MYETTFWTGMKQLKLLGFAEEEKKAQVCQSKCPGETCLVLQDAQLISVYLGKPQRLDKANIDFV